MKWLCFSPKPFLLWFAWSIAYKFHTTLSGYDWMKGEISGFVLANSIPDIATAPVFVLSGYYQWSLLFGTFFLIREHLILYRETITGSTCRNQFFLFVYSREKPRGTAANKHDISVCIHDILCTCLKKGLCFSPRPFYYDLLGLLHTNSTPLCPDMTAWNRKYPVLFWLTQSQILPQPLCLCFLDIIKVIVVLKFFFIRAHLILYWETLSGSTGRHQLYTFVFSSE